MPDGKGGCRGGQGCRRTACRPGWRGGRAAATQEGQGEPWTAIKGRYRIETPKGRKAGSAATPCCCPPPVLPAASGAAATHGRWFLPISLCHECSTRKTSRGTTMASTTGRLSPSRRRTTPRACWRRAPLPRSSPSTGVRLFALALPSAAGVCVQSQRGCCFKHRRVKRGDFAAAAALPAEHCRLPCRPPHPHSRAGIHWRPHVALQRSTCVRCGRP